MDFNRILTFINAQEVKIIGSRVQGGLINIITHLQVQTQWAMDAIQNMTFKTCHMLTKTSRNNFGM